MKALSRNKQTVYYALFKAKTSSVDSNGFKTGETEITYYDPVECNMNVSPANGTASVEMFGTDCQYTKIAVTADTGCPITETSAIWVGLVPSSTNPVKPNYRVVRVAKSLNSIAYALREVDVS